MAKRIFSNSPATPGWTATAAAAQATSLQYMAIKGGSTTMLIDVLEIMFSGQAAASAVGGHTFTRVMTLETGSPTALAFPASDGGANPNISALSTPAVTFTVSATNQAIPSNAATDAHLDLCTNLFGGIVRWNAAPFQQWQIVGSAVTLGESIFYNSTNFNGVNGFGTAHIIYEAT